VGTSRSTAAGSRARRVVAVALVALVLVLADLGRGGRLARADLAGERETDPTLLTLPFEGIWGVVQGFDSGGTHQGYAAFALDFAPVQEVGRFARLAHPRLHDFACYGRPVLAPADGRVVRVARGFPDLPPYARARSGSGGGNFVIIQHAPRLFSELVHLQARSVRVVVGQSVRRGQPVGACGNSGNARTPHLHLGLLSSIAPITTVRAKLARYQVRGADGRWTPGDGEPKEGQWLRPLPLSPAKLLPPFSSPSPPPPPP
jgi:murein DD-endopeptidase MepM/ murein hydrolase activator NlpD